MTDDLSRVLREAEEAARGRGSDLAQALADRVGLKAGAHAVFGQPVEREGITVIPVAKVRWGFGGGGDRGGRGDQAGAEPGDVRRPAHPAGPPAAGRPPGAR